MGVVARAKRARGEVHLVRLDPTLDSEIQKTRPCLVVSPDELNQPLRTVIIGPDDHEWGAVPMAGAVSLSTSIWLCLMDPRITAHSDDVRASSSTVARSVRLLVDEQGTGPE